MFATRTLAARNLGCVVVIHFAQVEKIKALLPPLHTESLIPIYRGGNIKNTETVRSDIILTRRVHFG